MLWKQTRKQMATDGRVCCRSMETDSLSVSFCFRYLFPSKILIYNKLYIRETKKQINMENEKYTQLGSTMIDKQAVCTPNARYIRARARVSLFLDPEKGPSEREIEAYLRRAVEARDGECVKLTSQYQRGLPDRLVLMGDHVYCFVELKTRTGQISKLQAFCHHKLRKQGHPVYVIRSIEQVDHLMSLIDNGTQLTNSIVL